MRTLTDPGPARAPASTIPQQRRVEWTFALLSCWLLAGLYLDGWAHEHFGDDLGTFFTPWHGFLYLGFGVLTGFIGLQLLRHRGTGDGWTEVARGPYGLSAVGVLIFVGAAAGDLVWHTLFGIEVSVEALYSPTHLLLASAAVIILSALLRTNWATPAGTTESAWVAHGPSVIGLILLLSLLVFFSEVLHSFAHPWAAAGNQPTDAVLNVSHLTPATPGIPRLLATDVGATMGIASVLLQAIVLVAFLLVALRQWGAQLPFGAITLLVALPAILVGIEHDQELLFPAAILGGVATEVLAKWLRPHPPDTRGLRLFAFLAPALIYAVYFVNVGLVYGIWWSVHLWAGAVFLAGAAGILISFTFAGPFGLGTAPQPAGGPRRPRHDL